MSPARLGQLARSGRLASVRVSGRLMFRAESVEAYLAGSGRDGETPPDAAGAAWEADLNSLAGWLVDVGDAIAPFEGLVPLPQVLPAGEDVPLEDEEEPEPAAVPAPAAEERPEPAPTVEAAPAPAPEPEPEPAPEPPPSEEPQQSGRTEVRPYEAAAESAPRPSRQALLAVQPVQRFAVLREVGDAFKKVPGVTEVRLERLDSGVASFRVTFAVEMPSDEAFARALGGFGLTLIVVGGR